MRRTVSDPHQEHADTGIISAHAENRGGAMSGRRSRWDHLRACGEQGVGAADDVDLGGSSPRMRRTGFPFNAAIRRRRIISAHAENSDRIATRCTRNKDHLRACGEQFFHSSYRSEIIGSSPRMRRTARLHTFIAVPARIISAHAENSPRLSAPCPRYADHLRACGEQEHSHVLHVSDTGSSPRMRRTGFNDLLKLRIPRIISAHAENSFEGSGFV